MRDTIDAIAAAGLILAMAGCSTFTPVKAPDAPNLSSLPDALVPASVAWPMSVGGVLLILAAVFVWIVLGNRRRALLMIAAGVACAILPPVLLDMLGQLVWPVVVVTTAAGVCGVAFAAKWAWQAWKD